MSIMKVFTSFSTIALILVASLTQGTQQQQQQSLQRQQESSLTSDATLGGGGRGQAPTYQPGNSAAAAATEYSALIADNLINLGQPIYTSNNKRARKMSAFMPMRGRKDGRDQQRQHFVLDSNNDNNLMEDGFFLTAILPPQQTRDSDDSSILRLVSSSGMAAAGSSSQLADPTGPAHWMALAGTPAPRQFANQFAARHLISTSTQPSAAENPSAFIQQQMTKSNSGGAGFDGGELAADGDSSSSSSFMQAKLRRAFHPMRGKKSLQYGASGYLPINTESTYSLEDMQTDFA